MLLVDGQAHHHIFPYYLIIIDYWPLKRFEKAGIIDCHYRHFAISVLWKWISFIKSNIKVLLIESSFYPAICSIPCDFNDVRTPAFNGHYYDSIPLHFRLFNFCLPFWNTCEICMAGWVSIFIFSTDDSHMEIFVSPDF